MCVVIFNAGSSSLRISVFNAKGQCIFKGHADAIGQKNSQFRDRTKRVETVISKAFKNHADALEFMMSRAPIQAGISASGHRIVHGGTDFQNHQIMSKSDVKKLERWIPWAPLHLPAQVEVLKWMQKKFPKVASYGLFDTAFHKTIPELEKCYAIPQNIAEKNHWTRYGFHGLNCEYITQKAHEKLKKKPNLIICHLGNGCSVTAVKKGISVGTSMGVTPLEGPMMGTRSGTLDPGLVLQMVEKFGLQKTERILTKESGFLGVSGLSSDVRPLLKAKTRRAKFTLELFARHIAKTIAQMRIALGAEPDAIVFSGGIGENAAGIRTNILQQLPFKTGKKLVIKADEERFMADFIAQQKLRRAPRK